MSLAGGTLIEKLHMENQVEEFIRRASAVDIASPTLTQKERLVYAKDQVAETFKKVFPYILIGVGIGAVIHNWIPESWVVAVLGSHNPFGVILATIIGIPMYWGKLLHPMCLKAIPQGRKPSHRSIRMPCG